ncbi:MAG: hypothetical protein G01um1014107_317 [Parcubacteria group bacterium Gr01-1014_107]|nr:MAG: hypothetical protein G01um1014107_317 [Parcubacteria group bacterium Gr01-1014_107]
MAKLTVSARNGYKFEEEVLRRSSEGMINRKPQFLEFRQAISEASARQPQKWDVRDPPTLLGSALFESVLEGLPSWLKKGLRLFVATGTALDYYHGIDGFFALNEGNILLDVPFDLSIEPHPGKNPNVEFVITKADFEDEEKLAELGRRIAARLAERREWAEKNNLLPR